MQKTSELQALLTLMDDPDESVYETVSEKLKSYGKEIIPQLKQLSESNTNNDLQDRLDNIIHHLQFDDLKKEFEFWKNNSPDLLAGAMLVAKYIYPNIDSTTILKDIEKLRRNIWLELNNFLTPLEQINIIGSIIYNYHKQVGVPINYAKPSEFLINKVLEKRIGNTYGNGTLYLILCSLLDIPVAAVNIPNQFLLGYFYEQYDIFNVSDKAAAKIKFYIDPLNGQMYSHKDVENYIRKTGLPIEDVYFKPFDNKSIIILLLSELSKCFDRETHAQNITELREIIKVVII
jgi:regulator of sirC expression with transglutaminase-like and TPR domain